MFHYLLAGWQRDIDGQIDLQWKILVDKGTVYNRDSVFRTMWFNMYEYEQLKIRSGDWLQEFRPFAEAYMRAAINGKCDGFEIYIGTGRLR